MRVLSLLVVCVVVKICVLAGRDLPLSWWSPIAYLWQDVLLALVFAGIDLALRRTWLSWALYSVLVFYLSINVPVARVLSTPLTWPLIRAAGAPLADSIWHYATWDKGGLVLLVLASGLGLPLLTRSVSARWARWDSAVAKIWIKLWEGWATGRGAAPDSNRGKASKEQLQPEKGRDWNRQLGRRASAVMLALSVMAALAYLGPLATAHVETLGLHRNAVVALLTSAFPRLPGGAAAADWRASSFPMSAPSQLSGYRGAAAGRNVVLVSLESTAARYLHLYGATENPMPRLSELARQSIVFENAYAVYPESIKGLYSVLCSRYPAIHTPPERYEQVSCEPLAERLAQSGYRTALFHSGRFDYLGMESVLKHSGYHTLEDAGQIGGDHNSSFGVDEPSTVKRILAWLDALPAGERFFITYLPIAGHHPYVTPDPGPFPQSDARGSYLNSLHYADAAIGLLIDDLRQKRLDRDTLWVIFGDHGEAFGQHKGNFGHTLFIYEENVHVPLLIAAPGLTGKQVRVHDVASLLDVTPTVLDLLGLASPSSYEGVSLLTAQPRMALFFTDYTLDFIGLRDERWKFIHEMDSGRSKLFDLWRDPEERIDLAGQHSALVAAYRDHLLRWCGYERTKVDGRSSTR